jgi:hypothetical protein
MKSDKTKERVMSKNKSAWIPEVIGDWWQIAGNPDLGKYQIVRNLWILASGKRLTGHGSCGPVFATRGVEEKPDFFIGGKERD